MKLKKNLYQAKGSEHYLIFIELSEQIIYTTDKKIKRQMDRYDQKKFEKKQRKKEKSCKKKSSSFSRKNPKEISSTKILQTICTKHCIFQQRTDVCNKEQNKK